MKNANKQHNKLNNKYELMFKDQGTLELCEDDVGDIPTITYNFVSISDLAQFEKDTIIHVLGVAKLATTRRIWTSPTLQSWPLRTSKFQVMTIRHF